MLAKRIIPCLDIDGGRVVKGINFINLTDMGDPVEIAKEYNRQNADEIVFLDITATHEKRRTVYDIIERTAKEIFIPLTVGGGIRTTDDFRDVLLAGADKVSINSSAVNDKTLISRAADKFGSQCVVVAIDVKRVNGEFHVVINGGRKDTGLDAIEWIKKGIELGAGEIVLNSIDADGVKQGFDLEMLAAVCAVVQVPVIASGGAGCSQHFIDFSSIA